MPGAPVITAAPLKADASSPVVTGKANAYPNPTFGSFTLTVDNVSKSGKVNVKIVDGSGRIVQQAVVNCKQEGMC
jgi:hypothetical protein